MTRGPLQPHLFCQAGIVRQVIPYVRTVVSQIDSQEVDRQKGQTSVIRAQIKYVTHVARRFSDKDDLAQ